MHAVSTESLLEDAPLSRFHKRLALYSAGGPFLDGYILSMIGVALVQATPQLKLSSFWEGMIGASALIGIFFGGFVGGWLTDKFGRQVLYTIDLIAIIVCSIGQFWVHDAVSLFALRLLIGIAVGADYGSRMVFITLFWTASVVPLFAVYAFGPKILAALGLTGSMGNIGSAVLTILFLVGSFASLLFVNRLGRRPLLLHSFFWSALALLSLGLFPNVSGNTTLAMFSAYAIFIGGTQILQWLYPNELFPTAIRATATGLAASFSRIGAAIGTYLVPMALETAGIENTMLIAAGITFLGFFISLRMAPETSGKSLDASGTL